MTATMMMMSGGHANLIRRAIRWIRVLQTPPPPPPTLEHDRRHSISHKLPTLKRNHT